MTPRLTPGIVSLVSKERRTEELVMSNTTPTRTEVYTVRCGLGGERHYHASVADARAHAIENSAFLSMLAERIDADMKARLHAEVARAEVAPHRAAA